jgi:hypothetical protein
MTDTLTTVVESKITKAMRQQYNTELRELKKDIGIVEGGVLRIAHRLALFKNGLYRVHYDSCEEFVKGELGTHRSWGYRLLKAEDVLTELLEDGVREAHLPNTERVCRELSLIKDRKLRKNIWERAELISVPFADTRYLAVEVGAILSGDVQDLWPKLINSETATDFFAHGGRNTYSNLNLTGYRPHEFT